MSPQYKVSLPARIAALLVRVYQLVLSPLKQVLFGSSCGCRFQPTCSYYSVPHSATWFDTWRMADTATDCAAIPGIRVDLIRFQT